LRQVDIEDFDSDTSHQLFTADYPTQCDAAAAAPSPPLVAALRAAAGRDEARFHFPGHNGGNAAPASLSQLVGPGPFAHDIPAFDDLFPHEGPLLEAQRKAAALFGSSETWFLVGGTTCGVQASIMATCSPGDTLILPRDSHFSATSAMVLSGAVPKYIMPAEYNPRWDLASGVTTSQVERAIDEVAEADGKKAAAVLVTSPTYQGVCSNLREIGEVCHSHGVPLIVDEAHGAHFKFHREFPATALEQGADLAVQSTHKVLCSLTQSSMLHMSTNGGGINHLVDRERLRRCLRTLQSTSPSPLLLASLDATRAQLSDGDPETIFDEAVGLAARARDRLKGIPGISVLGAGASTNIFSGFPVLDPLRLTVRVSELGLSGFEAADMLEQQHRIANELAGARTVTYALGLGTRREDVERLVSGFKHLSASFLLTGKNCNFIINKKNNFIINKNNSFILNDQGPGVFADILTRVSPREAFFAKKMRKVEIWRSAGEVCGELICPYPPGIPVLAPGEIITEGAIEYLLGLRDSGAVISGATDHQLSSIIVLCDQL
ncbi:hypothetical protein Taro_000648, partial [Colocasia esculenta]|nr:hypothetical protein [Colocasia esculenta]